VHACDEMLLHEIHEISSVFVCRCVCVFMGITRRNRIFPRVIKRSTTRPALRCVFVCVCVGGGGGCVCVCVCV